MKIQEVLPGDLMLSPLAGYTDAGFRSLAKDFGCSFTVTEMVSAKGLAMNNRISEDLLKICEDGLVAAQLFGRDPDTFAEALKKPCFDAFFAIDINMGCPQRKIINNGEGCALMAEPSQAEKVIGAVKKSTDKFVTVKFRKGFGNANTAVEFAKMCEGAGADALTVHGRTSAEVFSGKADWGVIADVVAAVKIPVFANGDIASREDYLNVKAQTGCFGVAVGRGALGRPYIFSEMQGKEYVFDVAKAVKKHVEILLSVLPERVAVNEMKKHLCCYLKGRRNSKKILAQLAKCSSAEELTKRTEEYLTTESEETC